MPSYVLSAEDIRHQRRINRIAESLDDGQQDADYRRQLFPVLAVALDDVAQDATGEFELVEKGMAPSGKKREALNWCGEIKSGTRVELKYATIPKSKGQWIATPCSVNQAGSNPGDGNGGDSNCDCHILNLLKANLDPDKTIDIGEGEETNAEAIERLLFKCNCIEVERVTCQGCNMPKKVRVRLAGFGNVFLQGPDGFNGTKSHRLIKFAAINGQSWVMKELQVTQQQDALQHCTYRDFEPRVGGQQQPQADFIPGFVVESEVNQFGVITTETGYGALPRLTYDRDKRWKFAVGVGFAELDIGSKIIAFLRPGDNQLDLKCDELEGTHAVTLRFATGPLPHETATTTGTITFTAEP